MTSSMTTAINPPAELDAVVVGAGFAGLYALYKLNEMGLSTRVLEAAPEVGGTWYWNRYPGARCDGDSVDYSYSFSESLQQDWTWTERFSGQPEILAYLKHVADRFDLRKDIQFSARVTSATFDETTDRWTVSIDDGTSIRTRYLVMATGTLSRPKIPEFSGLDTFTGELYFTHSWPEKPVEFEGKRVAVVGTGSSGMQAIPVIAKQAAHLTVFQRTANFSIPSHNRPLDPEEVAAIKSTYAERRRRQREDDVGLMSALEPGDKSALEATPQERFERFSEAWDTGVDIDIVRTFTDLTTDSAANELVAEFARSKIREKVNDPATADLLTPRGHPFGCKRLVVDTNYFETFNRDNVSLVSVRETPIEAITNTGIRTSDAEYPFDVIVLATGFDALSGPLLALDIRGRNGKTLQDAWSSRVETYLGLQIAGFPNLFSLAGPGGPSITALLNVSAEQHVELLADILTYMKENNLKTIEANKIAQQAWTDHTTELAEQTLYLKADSWWNGANIPGKPRQFVAYLGGMKRYREICHEVATAGWAGFTLNPPKTTNEHTLPAFLRTPNTNNTTLSAAVPE